MESIERNKVFDLAYRFVTETSENIFLTGKAGTGKTTFLKYLRNNCTKNIIVAAPTGVAAINAGGVTLHSLFQLPFHPFLPTTNHKTELLAKARINKQRQQLLRKMELLVIDEVSMVRCDVMDAIDTLLKSVRRNHRQPFGGVQLLCIGDLYQLSPVAQANEWEILSAYYDSPFFFDSHAVKEQTPLLIELNHIYRQKEEAFIALLNKVRNNEMGADEFDMLHERFNPGFRPPDDEHYITLTSHNNQADQINRQQLQQLFTPEYIYKAVIEKEFPENLFPAELELHLKEGAQVMFLKNDAVQKRYYNGKIGIIKKLQKEKIFVDCDGTEIELTMDTWEHSRYTLNRTDGKLQQETLGTFTQYPLRLAWAITIHKSQGLTFDKVMIDAGAAFSSGQVYVALSRCTRLDGIVLLSKIPATAIHSNHNVIKGQESLSHKGSLAERFAGARFTYTLQLFEELFSFRVISLAFEQLQSGFAQHRDKINISGGEIDAGQWIKSLQELFETEKATGQKFIMHISALMKEEPVVENNGHLQKRVSDAANHFISKFTVIRQSVLNHPLLTEHKETAAVINEALQQLYLSFYSALYYLEYCRNPFSLTAFLQHKLKFSQPRVNINCYAAGKTQDISGVPHDELYNILKRWRDMVVEESGLPIYIVANQATLKEICTYLPMNKSDLQKISGFGKAKSDKYGDDILEAVADYCDKYQVESNMNALMSSQKKERKPKTGNQKKDTKTISLELFRSGKSIAEIAEERKLTPGTIENHLSQFIGTGEININELVPGEKQKIIKGAAIKFGTTSLKTLIENMPPDISYNETRMVLASLKTGE